MVAISCALNLIYTRKDPNSIHQGFYQDVPTSTMLNLENSVKIHQLYASRKRGCFLRKATESEESVPSWAKPDSDELPPWARDEGTKNESKEGFEVPFYVYLLASAITAIAAVGSIFEYANQNPVFGVLNSDSVFYAPLLGFFVFTGFPTSAFLWYKSVQVANKEAEEQDRRDGYL